MTEQQSTEMNQTRDAWFRCRAMLWVYRVLCALFLLIAGYFLTYQLFFVSLPLEDYARKMDGGASETFRYDGVVYFDGRRLQPNEEFILHYGSVRVLDAADDKGIELFIRMDALPEGVDAARSVGTLHIENRVRDSVVNAVAVPLSATLQQRHTIPWVTEAGKRNETSITFQPADDGVAVPHISLSTNIVGVTYWPAIVVFALLGYGMMFLLTLAQRFRNLLLLAAIALAFGVMLPLHSGAFTSNEFFDETEDSILSTYGDAHLFFNEGEWKAEQYRSTGYMFVPAMTFLIEGLDAAKDRHFMLSTLPTPRYVMFAWFACALPLLIAAIWTYINKSVATIFGVLAASFFPFIVDLYNICDDAYGIPLFTIFLAAFITYAYNGRRGIGPIVVMVVTFFVMMTAKVTAAYLLLLVPFGLWLQAARETKKLVQVRPAILLLLMIPAFLGGRHIAGIGERYVKPGYPWASSTVPEILWAANGLYDEHSAFWFAKRGTTRTERIVEQTGLPNTAMIRHSAAADELVYKPQLVAAVQERPGYFYSTAVLRSYKHGLGFFKYRYGGSERWERFEKDGRGKKVTISGQEVYVLKHERQLIRKGKMWKISLLVFWSKFIQYQLPLAIDVLLLAMAVVGVFLLRRWDMGVLLLGCFGAKIVFNNFVHALVRYMDFNHIGLLLGLAVTLYCLWMAMGIVARRSFQREFAGKLGG